MPIQIPAFVQYQAPLVPLRGLWNAAPDEGDRFVSAELDWLNSPPGNAVQFQLAGNSPVALSQIVALAVANSGCGADVQFLFPDSASMLVVPARSAGVFPVFTNALMFYASAPNAIVGDRTVFHAFNSMPPPVQLSQSIAQQAASVTGVAIANGTTPVVAAGINGTVTGMTITVLANGGASGGSVNVNLLSGNGAFLWATAIDVAANQVANPTWSVPGLDLRFTNGLNIQMAGLSGTLTGWVDVNIYYSTP